MKIRVLILHYIWLVLKPDVRTRACGCPTGCHIVWKVLSVAFISSAVICVVLLAAACWNFCGPARCRECLSCLLCCAFEHVHQLEKAKTVDVFGQLPFTQAQNRRQRLWEQLHKTHKNKRDTSSSHGSMALSRGSMLQYR
jgi:hypothetical protein